MREIFGKIAFFKKKWFYTIIDTISRYFFVHPSMAQVTFCTNLFIRILWDWDENWPRTRFFWQVKFADSKKTCQIVDPCKASATIIGSQIQECESNPGYFLQCNATMGKRDEIAILCRICNFALRQLAEFNILCSYSIWKYWNLDFSNPDFQSLLKIHFLLDTLDFIDYN